MSAGEERSPRALASCVLDALSAGDGQEFGRLAGERIEIETARGVRRGHAAAVAWAANKYDHLQRVFALETAEELGGGRVRVDGRTEYRWKESGELADSSPVRIEMGFDSGELVLWRYLEEESG